MRAVIFKDGRLNLVKDFKDPEPSSTEVKIKVLKAGICRTDLEIIKGYMSFSGVLAHEFIGVVVESDNKSLIGKRVTSEINFSCGICSYCKNSKSNHCPNRSVLGIYKANGAMSEFCTVPAKNIIEIPSNIPDNKAIFIEPLAAATNILRQISSKNNENVCVLGDGKLGILCAWAMSTKFSDVTLIGHNESKLKLAQFNGVKTTKIKPEELFDIVIEATGTAAGINDAISLCKPRGKIILKSTVANTSNLNLSSIVINEIEIIGSRCGRFKDALALLSKYESMPLDKLISEEFYIDDAINAFKKAEEKGILKVVLHF